MIQTIAKISSAIFCILLVLTYSFGIKIMPMNMLYANYFLLNLVLLALHVSVHGFDSLKESK